ncbi:CRISPR/Cas system-associated protein Csm6 [Constrictibacter sp. MBR-5]|jgi:CRISPR/Cas system-associated protein Csm6|uniref:hypothetical protein n=1 Tax=Constrictibacter sp. MBR-5 TaxID=3156467 RepID=UPI0033975C8D
MVHDLDAATRLLRALILAAVAHAEREDALLAEIDPSYRARSVSPAQRVANLQEVLAQLVGEEGKRGFAEVPESVFEKDSQGCGLNRPGFAGGSNS